MIIKINYYIKYVHLILNLNFLFLIFDSATSLYRTDYSIREELRQDKIVWPKFLRNFKKIVDEHIIAVIISNQDVVKVDGKGFGVNDKKSIGRHIMTHSWQIRLYLRKDSKENGIHKIYDSPSLP